MSCIRRGFTAAAGMLALLATPQAGAETASVVLPGQLLVAADTMTDPRFEHTVIYVVDHSAQSGTLGLVVNQPLGDIPLKEFLDSIGAKTPAPVGQIRAYYGGPVEPSRVFLLLPPSPQANNDSTPAVVTTLDNVLNAINDENRPEQSILTLGYAGWSSGQLEAEIAAGDWHVIPFDETLVFGGENEQMWGRALQRRAIEL
ncbi:MAG: YqgE/AlgH family protein [Alphaproteobacteria bacterium]